MDSSARFLVDEGASASPHSNWFMLLSTEYKVMGRWDGV